MKNVETQNSWPYRKAAVIVAHPDDETLWAGGTILMHPETKWTIIALCRKNSSCGLWIMDRRSNQGQGVVDVCLRRRAEIL